MRFQPRIPNMPAKPVPVGGPVLGIERENAELREENARLLIELREAQAVFDVIPAFFSFLTPEGRLIRSNALAAHVVGRDPATLKGQFFWEAPWWKSLPEASAKIQEAVERCAAGESVQFDTPYWATAAHHGQTRWGTLSLTPLRDGAGKIYRIAASGIDITDRKASERYFESMVDSSPALLWTTEQDGSCSYLSKQWYEYTGQEPEYGLSRAWLDAVHPEDRDQVEQVFMACHETQSPFKSEYRLKTKGGEYRWVLDTGNPRIDPQGALRGYVGTVVDIHDIKLAENSLKEKATELERSNEELQEYAFVASHDLKEPLRTVSTYVELLARDFRKKLGPDADMDVRFITEAIGRMYALIDDLLNYSRAGREQIPNLKVDCNQIARAAISNLENTIAECNADVAIENLPAVKGNAGQLGQVFQNLISNALKYRSQRPPRIEIRCHSGPGFHTFSVSDNGIGIDSRYFEKIFGLFQRLHGKSEYSGTGLGLAICKRIIGRHHGRIWVESTPGVGSTFYFTLPRHD